MATPETETEPFGLHNLSPAEGSRRERKRVGRGMASGTGKTSGRGQKGQKSRSGSHNMRAGFIGGQMPLHMQLGKQRGPHKKTSMPMGPFRTTTQPVNLRDLERRFSAGDEVTPESLLASGILRHLRDPIKILGQGELTKALRVEAHGFSASARQKIEAAGGTASLLGAAADEAAAELALSEATPAEAIEGAAPPEAVAPDADEVEVEVEAEPEAGDEA